MLSGSNVALGVTGSIAAVRVVELAHEFRRNGAEVRGVMTDSSTDIVHPWTLEFATGHAPVTEITGQIEHVELCGADGWSDVFIIAPATANTIGKIAAAIADSPVTTCATSALGSELPIVIVPAMHRPMFDHPGVLDAIERLEEWGVSFVDPRIEEGKAKIADEESISLEVRRAIGPTPLAGTHVVVTAGATTEPIDPVRVLTNRASGTTGCEVAKACYALGADVTLIRAGDRDDEMPYITQRSVETAADMLDAVETAVEGADALVSAAAISDYTVDPSPDKIRSGKTDLELELTPTTKVLDSIRADNPELSIVGFKVETGGDEMDMIAEARRLYDRLDLEFVVANQARVMGDTATEAQIVDGEAAELFQGEKADLGMVIGEELASRL